MHSTSKVRFRQAKEWCRKTVRAIALASVLLAFPLSERSASAQPAQPVAAQASQPKPKARAECHIDETAGRKEPKLVHLDFEGGRFVAYYGFGSAAKQGEPKPAVRCTGPAEVELDVYPLFFRQRQKEGSPLTINYSIDGKTYTRETVVSDSGLRVVEEPLPRNVGIGKPERLKAKFGDGEHELVVLHPAGFIRIAGVQDAQPEQPKVAIVKKPQKKPEQKKPESKLGYELGAESSMLQFGGMENGAGGTMLEASLSGGLRLSPRWTLLLSPRFNSIFLSGVASGAPNDASLYAVELGLGARLRLGNHSISALVLPAHEWIKSSAGGIDAETHTAFGVGGELAYGYGHYLEVIARGSTNPINPASLRAVAEIPIRMFHPKLEVDARLLRLFGTSRMEGAYLVTPMDSFDPLVRTGLRLPGYRFNTRFGIIEPAVLAGAEFGKPGYLGTYLGAGCSAFILHKVYVDAGFTAAVDRQEKRFGGLLNLRIPLGK